jgi:hypothetical protein
MVRNNSSACNRHIYDIAVLDIDCRLTVEFGYPHLLVKYVISCLEGK